MLDSLPSPKALAIMGEGPLESPTQKNKNGKYKLNAKVTAAISFPPKRPAIKVSDKPTII